MRTPAQSRGATQNMVSFASPVQGWVKNRNISVPTDQQGKASQAAVILDNFIPGTHTVRLRKGSVLHSILPTETDVFLAAKQASNINLDPLQASTGGGLPFIVASASSGSGRVSGPVVSMFTYANGANRRLFAAREKDVFDVSTETAVPAIANLTSGDWSWAQLENADGDVFLRLVNGFDLPQTFNGNAWVDFTITGKRPDNTDLDPRALSFVWSHHERLWYIERNSLNAWYAGTGLLGGEVKILPLAGIFPRGGSLVMGASWSLGDGQAGGLSAQAIFVTDQGEVAVYQGTDPNDFQSFSLVGVYYVGRPLHKNSYVRAGGDIIIATEIGMIPLSQAVLKAQAALSPVALSYGIEDEWSNRVQQGGLGTRWPCIIWQEESLMVVVAPSRPDSPDWFVSNARTGAWSRFTGMEATCLATFNGRLYFGRPDGTVAVAGVGGRDVARVGLTEPQPYDGVCVPLFEDFGSPGNIKTIRAGRVVARSDNNPPMAVKAHTDHRVELPRPPGAGRPPSGSFWDIAVWDADEWAQEADSQISQNWLSLGGAGYAVTVSATVRSNNAAESSVEIIRIDAMLNNGSALT